MKPRWTDWLVAAAVALSLSAAVAATVSAEETPLFAQIR